MAEQFQYDVFISHSSQDKTAARELAERLRRDGLRVWFDECRGNRIMEVVDKSTFDECHS